MSKRNNFRLSKTKNNILYIFSVVSLALFAGLMLFPTINETTHAEGDRSGDGITVVISPEITTRLVSREEGYFGIVKDTVRIGTDVPYGYTLWISTDSEEHQTLYLNGDASSDSKIDGASGTFESPRALGNYQWGFAVPGVGEFDEEYSEETPSTSSKFAKLPTENTVIRDYTSATLSDDIEIYYGFKLGGTLEPGSYETNITYTAVPAAAPLTAKGVLTDDGDLKFFYNRTVYGPGDTYKNGYYVREDGGLHFVEDGTEATITNVYDNIPLNGTEEETFPWVAQSDSIFTARFDLSFRDARPTSLSKWFRNLKKLRSASLDNIVSKGGVLIDVSYMFDHAGYDVTDTFRLYGTLDIRTTNASYMFYYAGYNGSFDAKNLEITMGHPTGETLNLSHMFDHAAYKASTSQFWPFNAGSTWRYGRFYDADMSYMFADFGHDARGEYILDLFQYARPLNMSHMFENTGYNASRFTIKNIQNWETVRVTDMSYAFANAGYSASQWNVESFSNWNVSRVTNHENFINLNRYGTNTPAVNNQPRWRN